MLKHEIKFGELRYLILQNKKVEDLSDTIELTIRDCYATEDKILHLPIKNCPVKYDNYEIDEVYKPREGIIGVHIYTNTEELLEEMTLKEAFCYTGEDTPIRIRFENFKLSLTEDFDYRSAKEIPDKFLDVTVTNIRFVKRGIGGISTHGASGFLVTLACNPPEDYDDNAMHFPKECSIIE